jgi:hypothetical protein
MKIHRENVKLGVRLVSILLLVTLADGLVAMFIRRPYPWVFIIPSFIPLLVGVFVLRPMGRLREGEDL